MNVILSNRMRPITNQQDDFAALIPSVDISKSKSSSILLLIGLFQRRAGSEEVESLVGSEAEEE
jgi:hypothetical protein